MAKKPVQKKIVAFVTAVLTMTVLCGMPAFAFASSSGVTKEETVYVVTDSTGTQQDVIVSDHLQNKDKAKTISDETTLSDIENVKGEETFKQNGDSLVWNAEGNGIYYQGKTTKEVPVTMDVVYRLDDKVVSGSELQGKSGKVEIKINYTNNAEYEGTTVPFIVMTGLVVTDNSFKNIKVTKGKVIDDGEKLLVVGMAAPGLAQTVGIGESELGIGSSVTITGDAKEFAVEDMMTIVTNALFEDVDTGNVDLDYDDEIKALDDGAKKLVNGCDDLYDGLNEMDGKMPELKDGVEQVDVGAIKLRGSLKSQMKQIADTTGKLHKGSKSILEGLKTMKTGLDKGDGTAQNPGAINALNYVAGELDQGAQKAAAGAGELSTGATGLQTAADGLQAVDQGLKDGMDQAGPNLQAVNSNLEALNSTSMDALTEWIDSSNLTSEQKQAIKGTMTNYKTVANSAASIANAEYTGMSTAQAGVDQIYNGDENNKGLKDAPGILSGAATDMQQSATDLQTASGAIKKVSAGLKTMSDLLGAYDKYKKPDEQTTAIGVMTVIDSGLEQMQHQINDSVSGSGKLTEALNNLVGGTGKLKKGTDQLSDGVDLATDGSKKLSKGMSEIYNQGIKKIVDMYNDDLKGTLESVDGMIDAGKGYKTFTKLPSNMDGNVKFIYKTDMTD